MVAHVGLMSQAFMDRAVNCVGSSHSAPCSPTKSRGCQGPSRFHRHIIQPERRVQSYSAAGSLSGQLGANQHSASARIPPARALSPLATLQHVDAASGSLGDLCVAPLEASRGELGFDLGFAAEYRIAYSTPLGSGMYGVVYCAQHVTSLRMVAVKVMNKDREDDTRTREQHLACIKQEVDLWRACQSCKRVVRLEGVYEDERCVYLVQQLCSGGDLRAVLQGGRLTEREAAQVMRTVLEVIHTCHTQHHVYGDIKPANFLLLHPHRVTGCQQFPKPTSSSTPSSNHLQPPQPTSDPKPTATTDQPQGRRHSDTIREHLLASFQLPAARGAASASLTDTLGTSPVGLQSTLEATAGALESMSAESVMSGSVSNEEGVTEGPVRCQEMMAGAAAAGEAGSEVPAWMSVLTDARLVGHQRRAGTTGVDDGSSSAPSDVWLDRCGTRCDEPMVVLATDFGCCQPLHASHRKGVIRSKRLGSPVYMAPEMWQSGAYVGPGVDVWSAGVMLYQLLSGRYPFWPMSPEKIDEGGMQLYQVVCGIQSNPIHLTGDPWKDISRPCKALITAMLERQPQNRISARAALRHPWLAQQLGYTPLPSAQHDPINNSLDGGDRSD